MRTSTHVFATDLVDEGFGTVLDRARDLGHLDALTYAWTYHHARDILPHDPVRKVIFHEGGAAFFRPTPSRWEGAVITPRVSRLAQDVDPLARLLEETERRGMAVRVWTNNTHNTALGTAHPDATVENAFGDRYITSLCPAHPDVRRYIRDLAADVCRFPLAALVLETVCYLPFAHGYHHERSHYPYEETSIFLLGLCFCPYCSAAMDAQGIDAGALRRSVRAELERVLAGERSAFDGVAFTEAAVGALVGGAMAGALAARRVVVTTLLEEVVAEVRSSSAVPVVFMDWSGGLPGYATGEAEAEGSMARAWQDGVDLGDVVRVCDGVAALGYSRDRDSFEADLAAYRRLVPQDRELSVAIRPMTPDCTTPEEVRARTAFAAAQGADWLEFYHYGLMRLENLRWAGEAVAAASLR